ncbi:PAQR family membrane homeostasis protein TrhA [Dokdonella sp.]|uniref:PAQR family membrane homeostasis protein TrhA n=1 Tax=Dokdonella sp. TaxID=2291710 RepID=UPI0031C379B1|nr:hemolysin III family protein [Dokdonella sp.]
MKPTAGSPAPPAYGPAEERASSLIHALGIALSLAGLVLMLVRVQDGHLRHLLSVCVYGITLVALYTTSTLYHGLRHAPAKAVLRRLDHAAIFLLIAGTYTPFTLISLHGSTGWWLFGVVWVLALAGIALEFRRIRNRALMATLYVGLGWLGVVAIEPLAAAIDDPGLWLLLGGGIAYTVGVPFYLSKRVPYMHAVWHVFVLLGSVLQFFAVWLYVLPRP